MGKGVSRRELFTFWRRGAKTDGDAPRDEPGAPSGGENASQRPPAPPPLRDPLRPPGAIDELLFADQCQRCGKCVEICPRQALYPLPRAFGVASGTPAFSPRDAPCVMCDGLLCTTVCPSGALQAIGRDDVQLGTAVVDPRRCVTYAQTTCDRCIVACPVPGAIAADEAGHPLVDAGRCTGCGVCENVCPTGEAAIIVLPARQILR
jgi:MauM/NapG family ferredoxin protein